MMMKELLLSVYFYATPNKTVLGLGNKVRVKFSDGSAKGEEVKIETTPVGRSLK